MSAKKTQNEFSLFLITEMCSERDVFRFSLLQQDLADRRLKFFDRRQRHASSYARIFFSLALYSIGEKHIYHNTQSTYVQYYLC